MAKKKRLKPKTGKQLRREIAAEIKSLQVRLRLLEHANEIADSLEAAQKKGLKPSPARRAARGGKGK